MAAARLHARHGRRDASAALEAIKAALARVLSRLSGEPFATNGNCSLFGLLRWTPLVGLLNEYRASRFRQFSIATTLSPSAHASRPVARHNSLEANSDGQASILVSFTTRTSRPCSAITTSLFCHWHFTCRTSISPIFDRKHRTSVLSFLDTHTSYRPSESRSV